MLNISKISIIFNWKPDILFCLACTSVRRTCVRLWSSSFPEAATLSHNQITRDQNFPRAPDSITFSDSSGSLRSALTALYGLFPAFVFRLSCCCVHVRAPILICCCLSPKCHAWVYPCFSPGLSLFWPTDPGSEPGQSNHLFMEPGIGTGRDWVSWLRVVDHQSLMSLKAESTILGRLYWAISADFDKESSLYGKWKKRVTNIYLCVSEASSGSGMGSVNTLHLVNNSLQHNSILYLSLGLQITLLDQNIMVPFPSGGWWMAFIHQDPT